MSEEVNIVALVDRAVKRVTESLLEKVEELTRENEVLKAQLNDKYITGVEAAKILGITSAMVGHHRKTGTLPADMVGGTFKYRLSVVEKFKETYKRRAL